MKLTCISDTHTRHRDLDLPGGDILIHSGDFMNSGHVVGDIADFANWLAVQDYQHKILIAGNHDRMFEYDPKNALRLLDGFGDDSIVYLQDSEVVINGIKFYGSPWTPEFCGWAFALKSQEESEQKWLEIPNDVDVLITHGPAYGYLDKIEYPVSANSTKEHLGDKSLAKRIEKINPKLHVCGHIHSAQGVMDGYGEVTTHINASCLGEDYRYSLGRNYIEWNI
ncbi:MAG: metallophosphatase domain-containing protein [Candidatus Thioglobus sp.]|nr:metallophosphatase domain-containing protein [Candidatus Thioglobus pontius]MBL6976575.1 metallophosphatase domain-containing protein [Candidatus Thioglobus sp.]MBL6984815.1 metallophosphatase domain-containing protein [Candidatus Thioglobus sp.]